MHGIFRGAIVFNVLAMTLSLASAGALFEAPSRGGAPAPPSPPAVDSVLTLTGFMSYSSLQRLSDAKIPVSTPLSGGGRAACANIPRLVGGHLGHHTECRRVFTARICTEVPDVTAPSVTTTGACADYHWSATVTKDGPLSVSQAGAAVHVAQPLHITGQAGLNGTLAQILSLNAKNFDLRLSPAVDVSLDISPQWCPVVVAPPTGARVSSATVEIVGRSCLSFNLGPFGHRDVCAGPVPLGIANLLNDALARNRPEIEKKASEAISCDVVRSKIAAFWRPFAVKIPLDGDNALYLDVTPSKAAFSGFVANPDGIRVAVRVNARTSIEAIPISGDPLPLPALERLGANEGRLDAFVTIGAPYDLLKNQRGLMPPVGIETICAILATEGSGRLLFGGA